MFYKTSRNGFVNVRVVNAIDWTTCSENHFALQRVLLEFSAVPYRCSSRGEVEFLDLQELVLHVLVAFAVISIVLCDDNAVAPFSGNGIRGGVDVLDFQEFEIRGDVLCKTAGNGRV